MNSTFCPESKGECAALWGQTYLGFPSFPSVP